MRKGTVNRLPAKVRERDQVRMTPTARERTVGAGVALAAALLLLPGLGGMDLWAPDEPRYAEIADEIVRSNAGSSWLLLELNGEAYTQKPPLYYWLAALAGSSDNRVSASDARLPSALAGIAAVFLTYRLGIHVFSNPRAAAYAALLLLTSFRFAHTARRAQLDVLLTAFEILALLAFVRQGRGIGSRKINVALFHASLGAAVLTKGPVGLLPLVVVAAWLTWERRPNDLRGWFPAWGLALSLGPTLLWFSIALALAPPGFFESAVVENLFGRFFAGTSHPRPLTYYLVQFPADFMPWTILWPLAAVAVARNWKSWTAPTSENGWRFGFAWLGVFLLFFSLSTGKRGLYLLPAFPAAALLCGAYLDHALANRPSLPVGIRWSIGFALAIVTAGSLFLFLGPPVEIEPGFEIPPTFSATAAGLSFVALVLHLACSGRPNAAKAQVNLILAWVFFMEVGLFAVGYPAFDAEKSPRPIARAANRIAGPDGTIGLYRESALLGGLIYYGRLYGDRPVVSLSNTADVDVFFERGGKVLVARRQDLSSFRNLEEIEFLRSGERAIGLATRAHGEPGPFHN